MLRQFGRCSLLWTVAALAVSQGAGAQHAPALDYPPPVRGNTVDDYHGTSVPDPYRGMEELDSAATRAWVASEAQLTDRYLDALPGHDRLQSRLLQVFNYKPFGVAVPARGALFSTPHT